MTRARCSLAAMSVTNRHPYLAPNTAVLVRQVTPDAVRATLARRVERSATLSSVNLLFAGGLHDRNPAPSAIAAAKIGDPIELVERDGGWFLRRTRGPNVGRMANSWMPSPGRTFRRGTIGAIVQWRRTDSSERYQAELRRDLWETVLPDLIFE